MPNLVMRLNAFVLVSIFAIGDANATIFASYMDPISEANITSIENTYSRLYAAYPYNVYKDSWGCPETNGITYNNFDPNYATRRSGCGGIDSAISALIIDLERASKLYPNLSLIPAIDVMSATSVRGGLIDYGAPFKAEKNIPRPDASCSKSNPIVVGNPIVAAIGNKIQAETIIPESPSDSLYRLKATYVSMGSNYPILGMKWSTDYSAKLGANNLLSQGAMDNGRINSIYAARDDGLVFGFKISGGAWISDAPHRATLRYSSGYYYLTDLDINVIDKFNADGKLIARYKIGGEYAVINQATSQVNVTTAYGRTISFSMGGDGSATSATDASGGIVNFGRTGVVSKMLASITFQDGSLKKYGYSDRRNSTLLTDLTDEIGTVQARWTYDALGRAISSEHHGGVEKTSINFSSQTAPAITLPSGEISKSSFSSKSGQALITSQSQPAGSGCGAAASNVTYDGNGVITSATDFIGGKSCFAHDSNRRTELLRVEGFISSDSCPADLSAYQIPSTLPVERPQRKISTLWHPDWRLKVRQAQPNLITTWIYNGQPNPLNGNALAACAPSSALLPDGKPIVVLCARIKQATIDLTGSNGFSATQSNGTVNQQENWTYNQFGQVLTYDGPRTDVNDVSTYAYYTDTTIDHTIGDLKSSTNAVGKIINYTKYNKHGQALTVIDSNNIATNYTYDARLRPITASVGGQITVYTYYSTGLLKRVARPDGSYFEYEYDGAHRLIVIADNLGNRIDYTLDNVGNVQMEKVADPAGVLKRSLSRSFDALGRTQQISGRE